MRKAVIDLDWLDGEIEQTNKINNSFEFLDSGEVHLEHEIIRSKLKILKTIRDSCTPIEPFLSKTCTNNWESNKYCSNEGKCELCKIKQ